MEFLGENNAQSTGKSVFSERMQKRDETRQSELQELREDRLGKEESNRRNVDRFVSNFQKEKCSIEAALEGSGSLDRQSAAVHFEVISTTLQQLQKYVTDSALFLPSYDLKQAQMTVGNLQASLTDWMDKVIPKKKFAFKSRKKEAAAPDDKPDAMLDKPKKQEVAVKRAIDCGFVDQIDMTLTMFGEEIEGKDVDLARLKNCTVHLLGTPSAMHISTLEGCLVICGPLGGSIFMDNCKDCTFVLAAQQIRIHTTTNTKFYVHVTSKAIIEDSNTLLFGTYNLQYPDMDEHFKQSGLDRSTNNWNDVDDFNWLASDARSPNWDVFEASEAKSFVL